MMQGHVLLLGNIGLIVGELEQLNYFSFVHFQQKYWQLIFLIFDKIYETHW